MPGAEGAPPVVELVLLVEVAWLKGGAIRRDMMEGLSIEIAVAKSRRRVVIRICKDVS